MTEVITNKVDLQKADVGARLVSYILDVIIVNVVALVVGNVLTVIPTLLSLAISTGYFTYFFGNGQTLGMKAVKIKLCDTEGTYPIGYVKGFLRWIGMIISGLVIGIGYLWVLVDENKQGWHDKIAGTYVVVEKEDAR